MSSRVLSAGIILFSEFTVEQITARTGKVCKWGCRPIKKAL